MWDSSITSDYLSCSLSFLLSLSTNRACLVFSKNKYLEPSNFDMDHEETVNN